MAAWSPVNFLLPQSLVMKRNVIWKLKENYPNIFVYSASKRDISCIVYERQLGRKGNPGSRDNLSSYKHFGSPSRDNSQRGECHDYGFEAKKCIKEVKINFAKHTGIEWPTETQRMKDIGTYNNSIEVMNNHAGSTLTRPVGKPFSHINAR